MKEMFVLALLLLAASVCSARSNALEREKLISAAIQDMEKEMSTAVQYNKGPNGATTSSELLHAFKRASQQAVMQGKARIKFEKLIHNAERSILENERREMAADMSSLAKAEEIAKVLMSKPGSVLTKDEVAMVYQEAECPEEPTFDCNLPEMQTMRSVTGVCNNLEEPLLGSSGTAFRRLIEPQYEDGFSQLRGTMQSEENSLFNGGPFQPPNPSPRIISLSVIQDQPIFNNDKTHLLMQWGQFMDHDLDLAPAFREPCKGCEITEQCVPIRVPTSDPIFGMPGPNQDSLCNPFPRSIPACDPEAANGEVRPRQQINELTSFIDASQVYGSRQKVFDAVRDLRTDGLLRTGPKIPENGGVSLPIDTDDLVECMGDQECFLAGDVRVNEHLSLTVIHTLWLREHNRIAFELLQNSPGTSSEIIFQRARAIVGAEIQKITFKDYLPLLLGSAMSVIKPYTGYKADVNPTVPNAFAAAAFRFGHSQINPFFDRLDENNMPLSIGPLNLLDAFFNPSQYTISNGTDPILRGLLQRPARSVDEFVNDILTNHLFQTNASLGMDLAALNIQRGRDHGLPPYLTWRRWAQQECGISSEFINDLTEVRLLQTYGTLETVDLWVGGLSEEHVSGGLLGATFACIFAKTFEALRDGDRFYYENPESALFSAEQRESLEDASLSRIICDNSDNINTIQENAFRGDQASISCSSIKRVALENWNKNDEKCYLRAKVNRQMGEVELKSISRLRGQKREFNKATLGIGVNTACLPIVCPVKSKLVRVGVFIDNNRQCRAQRSTLLTTRGRRRALTGKISLAGIEDSANGAYKSLSDCNSGTRNEVIFNCNARHVAAVESNEELLQDLETSLTQTASSKSTSSIGFDVSAIPDEILEYMKDEFEDESAESVHSEQSNVTWKEETINTLESLLATLKAEQNNNKSNKKDEATDQELYKNLAKLLKTVNK